jgi:hypothetical protein
VTPAFSSDRTALVRRNRFYLGLSGTLLFAAFIDVIAAAVLGMPQLLAVVPHLLIFGTMLPLFVWAKNPKPRDVPARIEANEQGIFRDGQLLVPRALVRDAFVMPRSDGAVVVRVRRKGLRFPVDVRVTDREEGRRLLRALGLDASQAAADFRLPSRMIGDKQLKNRVTLAFVVSILCTGAMLVGFGLLHWLRALPIPVALHVLGIGSFVTLATWRSRLRVGADGILHTWIRYKRFLPYGDMTLIRQYEDDGMGKNRMLGIEITLKSGEVVRISVQNGQGGIRDQVAIIEERIAEAVDTWRRGGGFADAALVGRCGRAPGDWLRALRGIGAGANADARTAPVLPDKLWRIVEDPSAPPDARAGAAVALGATIDGEGRARLKAAAEVIAAPRLRIAIEAAAKESPEEELAAALAEVESEGQERRAAEPR